MAEALKTFFSPALVQRLAASLTEVHPSFPAGAFVRDATRGLDALELTARGRHLAAAMHAHLPKAYPDALPILLASLGPPHGTDELLGVGMAPFFYLPHVTFVATYGLDHFDLSMEAQHALTQRFTCEWSVRPFLVKYPDATLAVLRRWTKDRSPHVRRLVSEGTRPRLPWATRVPWIDQHPERVLPLLEALKDDPASVVRRSVANHLNDLAKGHRDLALEVATRWLEGAPDERRALVAHGLRTSVKAGDRQALALLGAGARPRITVSPATFTPKRVAIGGATRVEVCLTAEGRKAQTLAVDLVVRFVKASGKASPKVFKLKRLELAPGASVTLAKTVSLAVHTTRRPFAGRHAVELLVNGETFPVGAFQVVGQAR